MGCISSKAMCRSISIREEVSHGLQSWEELITSNGSKDQLFALLSSSKLTTSFKSTDVQTKYDLSNNFDGVSKSCQLARDKENKLDRNDKNLIGSRSFHTVEEFDALLDRIHKLGEYSWEDDKLKGSNSVETSKDSPKNDLNLVRENGWKRKAVGKGLKWLDVPNIEFEQREYSPTTSYVTPKFGSYNVGLMQEKEGGSTVFSPELVAAFEDCMQQLQVDEDIILREMDGWMDD
ncbi:hypothetical protein ACS0TY_033026 [Phlomoides rotata]